MLGTCAALDFFSSGLAWVPLPPDVYTFPLPGRVRHDVLLLVAPPHCRLRSTRHSPTLPLMADGQPPAAYAVARALGEQHCGSFRSCDDGRYHKTLLRPRCSGRHGFFAECAPPRGRFC
jgi:hypothetical protein